MKDRKAERPLAQAISLGLVAAVLLFRIPPRVEYSLSEKGKSVVSILQDICKWSGLFYKETNDNTMTQCQKCDYRN